MNQIILLINNKHFLSSYFINSIYFYKNNQYIILFIKNEKNKCIYTYMYLFYNLFIHINVCVHIYEEHPFITAASRLNASFQLVTSSFNTFCNCFSKFTTQSQLWSLSVRFDN